MEGREGTAAGVGTGPLSGSYLDSRCHERKAERRCNVYCVVSEETDVEATYGDSFSFYADRRAT